MEETRVTPSLLAFLMCERVDTAPDGVQSLVRVFDRTILNVEVQGPPGVPVPDEVIQRLSAPFEFTLFAKWGNGVGHFRQWVEIVPPQPEAEPMRTPETSFWLQSRTSSHNTMGRIRMNIRQAGRYLLRMFLDGEQVAESVWVVEINLPRARR